MYKMKYTVLFLFILTLFLACEPISPENISLGGEWKLKYDPDQVGLREGWFGNDVDRTDWEMVAVPGNWPDIDHDGFAWYATEIKARSYAAGYKWALVFDSVDDNAVIWLDGRLFEKHNGYGIKFFSDIGDKISDGKPHQLVVRIEDTGGGGGINGEVYLQPYLEEIELVRSEASTQTAPEAPEWAKNATIYEIFVRSHSMARSFRAVRADLNRIKKLGIDLIWLMPIHPIGVKNHKFDVGAPYAVQDYYKTNPRFGTLEDFQDLVQQTHDRDMKLILDMVLNHTAWDNPLIDEHPEWYTKDELGEIVSPNADWWDTADLNYDNPELRKWMIDMLVWWIKETGVDGFRFDVAELVPNDFWLEAKAACKAANPEIFFLAEGARPDLHLSGHDMTYSWNIWNLVTKAAQGEARVSQIKQSYEDEAYQYPKNALRMRFTENHDKTRSRSYIGDADLNKTAWAFIALMKGNPLIYAGQEVGAKEQVDIHLDPVIYWSRADRELEKSMGEILALRKAWITPESNFEIILADDEKQIIAYRHGSLLAFFNFSDTDFEFSAEGMDSVLYGAIKRDNAGRLTLPAKGFGVIK
ncbi:MAG: hypothetical protein K9N35_08370 [Candidatus Marinimicrobia bacterium]|nr:hypothetical protein [Candidatus Neomarinimicrobiota bacterium]